MLGMYSFTDHNWVCFRSVYRSVLSQLTTPSTRADVLAWYVTTSTLGSSIGSEASGRIIHYLQSRDGWTEVDAYHSLFWIYAVMGIVNALFVLLLSDACELQMSTSSDEDYARVPQEEVDADDDDARPTATELRTGPDLPDVEAAPATPRLAQHPHPPPPPPPQTWTIKTRGWLSRNLSQISAPTRAVMYKLWFLLGVDSLADGMVPYSLTNYYMDEKFHPSKSTLGDVTSVSYFLGAVGAVFAGPLARHIGLINTMVFTHVPSSAAVLVFPLPRSFWLTAALLLLRTALNNMDQAPRAAFIAAVVRPHERTAVMGLTSMLRNLAAMAGPTVTGLLAGSDRFGVAFVVAGVCRLAYDFGLYAMFVNMKLHQHEAAPDTQGQGGLPTTAAAADSRFTGQDLRHQGNVGAQRQDDVLELDSLAGSESADLDSESNLDSGTVDDKSNAKSQEGVVEASANSYALHLQPHPASLERVRSRSPHRSSTTVD